MTRALRRWADRAQRDVLALYLAARDPRVPWYAKLIAALVAAYALSPIDLIPDPIPVLGLLDDLIVVPLGIWLAVKLVPPGLMAELRREAEERLKRRPKSWRAAAVVLALWLAAVAALGYALSPLVR